MIAPIIRCAHTRTIPTAEAMLLRREKNPNGHPPEQLRMLGKIIGATGWRSPVTISRRSGRMTKGHGRTEAAHLAGFPFVPIDERDYDSDEQEIADVMADNLIAEMSELDPALVKELAEALARTDFDTELAGLTNEMFADLTPRKTYFDSERTRGALTGKEDEIAARWNVQEGDLWELGDHRLLCGDVLAPESWERIGDAPYHFGFADPPYELTFSINSLLTQIKGNLFAMLPDTMAIGLPRTHFAQFFVHSFNSAAGPQRKNSPEKGHVLIAHFAMKNGFAPKTLEGLNSRIHTPINHEGDTTLGNTVKWPKPPIIMDTLMSYYIKPGHVVMDAFSGSGATLFAADARGLKCRSVELNPMACAWILERWKVEKNVEPKRLETNELQTIAT